MPCFRSNRCLSCRLVWTSWFLLLSLSLATASLDLVFVLDATGTVNLEFAALQSSMPSILSQIVNTVDPDTRFGVASFQDYAIQPFGILGTDEPYLRQIDLTSSQSAVLAALQATTIGLGGDNAESGLAAIFQLITGEGQIYGQNQMIVANQQMTFRSSATKILVLWSDSPFHDPIGTIGYPGPSFTTVINELTAASVSPPFRFVGLSIAPTAFSSAITADMQVLTSATNARATRNFTCFGNGGDVLTVGNDLVCTGVNRENPATLTEAFVTIVEQAYFIDNPNGAPSPSPPGTTVPLACFSGQNTVVERTRGTIPMDQVRVGDWLWTGTTTTGVGRRGTDDAYTYSRVLSLAHSHPTQSAQFVQIYTNATTTTTTTKILPPLEMTPDHLLFVNGTAQRAGTIRPGDQWTTSSMMMMMTDAVVVVVTRVATVQRRGIYAPITETGDFLVQGGMARVSSYVDVHPHATATTTAWWWTDAQFLGHLFYSPLRIYCRLFLFVQACDTETYDPDTGYSNTYGSWMLPWAARVPPILVAPLFGLCWCIEQVLLLLLLLEEDAAAASSNSSVLSTTAAAVLIVAGTAAWRMRRRRGSGGKF